MERVDGIDGVRGFGPEQQLREASGRAVHGRDYPKDEGSVQKAAGAAGGTGVIRLLFYRLFHRFEIANLDYPKFCRICGHRKHYAYNPLPEISFHVETLLWKLKNFGRK